jgi:hypothetical protein
MPSSEPEFMKFQHYSLGSDMKAIPVLTMSQSMLNLTSLISPLPSHVSCRAHLNMLSRNLEAINTLPPASINVTSSTRVASPTEHSLPFCFGAFPFVCPHHTRFYLSVIPIHDFASMQTETQPIR